MCTNKAMCILAPFNAAIISSFLRKLSLDLKSKENGLVRHISKMENMYGT